MRRNLTSDEIRDGESFIPQQRPRPASTIDYATRRLELPWQGAQRWPAAREQCLTIRDRFRKRESGIVSRDRVYALYNK